ncbi:MAG: hypothetical protein AABZ64_16835 [Nitrospinota bacterium]
MTGPIPLLNERLRVADTPEALLRLFEARGWGDGLPAVPPTPERVEKMIEGSGLGPGVELGVMPPRQGVATVETLAVNAVLAGCLPAYMPVLVAAVRAVLDPAFSLHAIQATTHPAAPLILVNGPIAGELGINGGYGCFGPGHRANATLGRALRLALLHIGGASPGALDRSTQGSPAKYTFCIAENEAESPWPPFHTERGFARERSAVTVIGAEGPHNVNDHVSHDAGGLLATLADTMAVMGSNNFYLRGEVVAALGPEHAATLAGEGLSKAEVRRALHARARKSVRQLSRGGMWGMRDWPPALEALAQDPDAMIPLVDRPEDILLLVAGGAGKHSAYLPTFGPTRSVTVPVETPAGAPAR